jgi:hypothetical protein
MKSLIQTALIVVLVASGCGNRGHESRTLDIDISGELSAIQDQLTSGFCQSFAFTGLLEQRWFQKVHSPIKISEKSLIRAAIRTVIETYWNDKTLKFDEVPFNFHIGNIGMSHLLKAVSTYGVVPESAYPTTTVDASGKRSFTFDLDAYSNLVGRNATELNYAGVTKESLLRAIDELFGAPQAFVERVSVFSYETYADEIHVIQSPTELRDFLDFHIDSFSLVLNEDGFVEGQNVFNPANKELLIATDRRFTKDPIRSHAGRMLDVTEQLLDQGIPIVMWNKWQSLVDGVVKDSGGHLTVLVGYENLPDHTRWYRAKSSGGVNSTPKESLWPNTTHPIRSVNGYIYFERDVLEKALLGVFVPAIFGSHMTQ